MSDVPDKFKQHAYEPFVDACADLKWPVRGQDSTIVYERELHKLTKSGMLANPIFVTWDDWDLAADAWHPSGTLHFLGPGAKRLYILTSLAIHAARELRLISPEDKGMSQFVYRSMRKKSIVHIEKAGVSEDSVIATDGHDRVIAISICPSPKELFSTAHFNTSSVESAIEDTVPRGAMSGKAGSLARWEQTTLDNAKNEIHGQKDLIRKSVALLLKNACRVFGARSSRERASVRDVLIASWLWASIKCEDVLSATFIPARGFLPSGTEVSGLPEECSGGIYYWSSNHTSARPLDLQVYLTFRGLRTSVDDWNRLQTQKLKAALRSSAVSAIMVRNFSHNVGSHSLANPRLYDSLGLRSGDGATSRLRIFNNYSQGRLDFMARAMSGGGERPEPLFLVNDVLNGFFRQGVLLDTLVEDVGYAADKIEFTLELPNPDGTSTLVAFRWVDTDDTKQKWHCFRPDVAVKDVLVGISGGSIGCHALYAFLENCIRNAVKYGGLKSENEKLIIALRLEKCMAVRAGDGETCEVAWVLRISDNISVDRDRSGKFFAVTDSIRKHINTPLVGGDEEREGKTHHGHGIQEMKVCAETLAGGDRGLRFPADTGPGLHGAETPCAVCGEYAAYRSALKDAPRNSQGDGYQSIHSRQALRCYSHPTGANGERMLVYNLLLPCPVLIGIVAPGSPGITSGAKESLPEFVRRYSSLADLARSGAHLGFFVDDNLVVNIEEQRKVIARLHTALPYRYIIMTKRPKDWRLDTFQPQDGEAFRLGVHIPQNRIRFVEIGDGSDPAAMLQGFLAGEVDAIPDFLGAQGWHAAVLRAYDIWLRAFKPLKGAAHWNLCVGFERSTTQVESTSWKDRVSEWGLREPNPCIAINIATNDAKTAITSPNWPRLDIDGDSPISPLDIARNCLIAFDNHGKIYPELSKSFLADKDTAHFYQQLGLKESLALYQSLANPPDGPFAFALLIYQLVESALLNVAVLDERVAQSTIDGDRLLNGGEKRFQKAGIYPLFSFKIEGDAWNPSPFRDAPGSKRDQHAGAGAAFGALSTTISDAAHNASWTRDEDDRRRIAAFTDVLWNNEGLHLAKPRCVARYAYLKKKDDPALEQLTADVLVVHEGVTDALEHAGRWSAHDLDRIYECVPSIVRTSGRGSDSRHLGQFLPFVEFSDISANTYESLNKLALGRSLLGSTGSDIPPRQTHE